MRYVTFIALLLCVPVCRALPTTRPSEPLLPMAPEEDDPFSDITDKMSDVLGDLASKKTDKPVQAKQQEIVSELDALIAELEKKQKQGNGSSGSLNPSKPMADSVIAGGPGGIHDLKDPKAGTRNFANLPPRDRDAILQSKTEGFPPGYESLLQSYYQRLAQEKSANTP